MNPWSIIIIGALITVLGGVITGYGWYSLSGDNSKVEEMIKESTAEIIDSIDQKISTYNEKMTLQTNINDPRMSDGGKVAATIYWKDGPILDIGNRSSLGSNRILVTMKYPDQIYLFLYDENGKKYSLQGEFAKFDSRARLECIWSSKGNFIAIMIDGKIVARVGLPDFTVFHDTGMKREILVGHNFEGIHGSGNIKEVQIYTLKEL